MDGSNIININSINTLYLVCFTVSFYFFKVLFLHVPYLGCLQSLLQTCHQIVKSRRYLKNLLLMPCSFLSPLRRPFCPNPFLANHILQNFSRQERTIHGFFYNFHPIRQKHSLPQEILIPWPADRYLKMLQMPDYLIGIVTEGCSQEQQLITNMHHDCYLKESKL